MGGFKTYQIERRAVFLPFSLGKLKGVSIYTCGCSEILTLPLSLRFTMRFCSRHVASFYRLAPHRFASTTARGRKGRGTLPCGRATETRHATATTFPPAFDAPSASAPSAPDTVEMELHKQLDADNTLRRLRNLYDVPHPGWSQERITSQIMRFVTHPAPDALPEFDNEPDTVDVWIHCRGVLLLTSVESEDFPHLYDMWEDYGLDDKIGPSQESEYGIFEELFDDRSV